MSETTSLFKTTIEIFTSYDPSESEILDLAREATDGGGYCSKQEVAVVSVRHLPQHAEGVDAVMEFFDATESAGPTVTTSFRTDDRTFDFTFDVTDALAASSDEELLALRDIGWGGDYEADHFFMWYADQVHAPEAVLAARYLEARNCGFEVYVDVEQAEAWVRAHRPAIAIPAS